MRPARTRLVIPGMCDEGPPSYAELETDERVRIQREAALSKLEPDRTYCVHFSSLREILTTQELRKKIERYPDSAKIHVEYFHEVPAGIPQDPRNPWLTKMGPAKDEVSITNTSEDSWDKDQLLFLPDGAAPVTPELSPLDIYTAMVIGYRSETRDFSDKEALDKAKPDVQTAITYVTGRIEFMGSRLDEETKHRTTMAQMKGMPVEMLDRSYNLHRL